MQQAAPPTPDTPASVRLPGADPTTAAPAVRSARTKWALGYVAGRVRGYVRGSIKWPMVMGAVDVGLRNGLTMADVTSLLAEYGVILPTPLIPACNE
jgi:hypothetical protein